MWLCCGWVELCWEILPLKTGFAKQYCRRQRSGPSSASHRTRGSQVLNGFYEFSCFVWNMDHFFKIFTTSIHVSSTLLPLELEGEPEKGWPCGSDRSCKVQIPWFLMSGYNGTTYNSQHLTTYNQIKLENDPWEGENSSASLCIFVCSRGLGADNIGLVRNMKGGLKGRSLDEIQNWAMEDLVNSEQWTVESVERDLGIRKSEKSLKFRVYRRIATALRRWRRWMFVAQIMGVSREQLDLLASRATKEAETKRNESRRCLCCRRNITYITRIGTNQTRMHTQIGNLWFQGLIKE